MSPNRLARSNPGQQQHVRQAHGQDDEGDTADLPLHPVRSHVPAALRAGARGYLLKGAGHADIVHAIAAVAAGTAVFGPSIAQRLIDYFATQRTAAPFPELTEREREILNLIAAGNSNTAIAGRLYLSTKTVRNHVSNIFSKMQVADRAQAIVRARKAGLGAD